MPRPFSDRKVLELVECAYAAGCDPREWTRFVGRVHETIPGVAFSTHVGLEGTTCGAHSASAGIPQEYVESYLAHYQFINPYNALFHALAERRIYTTTELVTRDWLESHVFYHEWLKPAGDFTHGASVVIARDPRRLMRASFDIPNRLARLEPACADLLRRLGPHMARAFEVNERLEAAVVAEQALDAVLQRLDGAAVLLAASGRVLAMNAEAERLAQAGTLFRVAGDKRVAFRSPAHDAAYRRGLAAAFDPGEPASQAFAVEDASLGRGTVTLLPLRPAAGPISRLSAGAMALLLARSAKGHRTPKDLLKALYGLTAAEAELVAELASGTRITDAAERFGISRATARNHLAAAMNKMGVHRQAELVAAVGALTPRLRM